MFSLSNQIKAPDDEQQENHPQDCDNSLPITFLNHHSWIPHNHKSPVVFASDLKKRKNVDFESVRKDRHSKVRTARGPRDRRVRLSPRTAIQFYDVQDRLGYDRPSKAIDWLIQEAKAAIDALNDHSNVENLNGFFIEPNPDTGTVTGPGFGFCVDGAPAAAQAPQFNPADLILHQNYQQGFSEANWEFARLQKMLEISGNPPPQFYSPAAPVAGGNVFSQREPLQSSFINYSPISNGDFPAFNFCNELLNVTASAMKQDERED